MRFIRRARGTAPPGSTLNPLCHAPVCGRMSLRALPVSFLASVEGSLEHVCMLVCAKCGQTVWGCVRLSMLLLLLLLLLFVGVVVVVVVVAAVELFLSAALLTLPCGLWRTACVTP